MLNGKILRDAVISAANNIANHRKNLDALNVFPVPDGDTGTNMSMTIEAAKRELLRLNDNAGVGEVSSAAASALLRGARGNSGVILSLLFRGFDKGLREKTAATASDIASAWELGVTSAYQAVMKPTEGTMLTVARESAEAAKAAVEQNPDIDTAELFKILVTSAQESLDRTPELLPVLKKAGVVDSGGKGIVVILEGMSAVISGGGIVEVSSSTTEETAEIIAHPTELDGEITFTYCTEFIVLKSESTVEATPLRAYLESIGDSAVVVDDDEIIKCHVHTDNPGNALQKGLEFGMITSIKIDNMREQTQSARKSAAKEPTKKFAYAAVDPSREYGFVAVCAGDGVRELFGDLGVDNIVSGGQTMNPSTDDILEATHATPAKTVIVLPNNKNIIMAAEMTIKLADRGVYVLPTKTIPQGMAALLAFDPDAKLADNQLGMVKAVGRVTTGQVTFAARNSNFGGHKIKKDDILALENGKLAFAEKDVSKAVLKLIKSMLKKDSSFLTVLYGADVTEEQAAEMETLVRAKIPDTVELTFLKGGQPVYYYIISAE